MRFLNRFHDSDVGRGQPRSNRSGWDDFKKSGGARRSSSSGWKDVGKRRGAHQNQCARPVHIPVSSNRFGPRALFRYASAFFMTMASGGGRRRRAGLCGQQGRKFLARENHPGGCDLTGAHRRAGKPKIRSANSWSANPAWHWTKTSLCTEWNLTESGFVCLRCDRRPLIATLSVSGSGRPA